MTIAANAAQGLDSSFVDRVLSRAKSAGIGQIDLDWLHAGRACDVLFKELDENSLERLREMFHAAAPGIDIFIQKNGADRRKKLFVADMDATMVEGETLDDLSAAMNLKDKIAPITASAMRGEIDFNTALTMRVSLLKGLPVSALMSAVEETKASKGADVLLKTLKRHGVRCVLVSGGFDIFTGHVASILGFDRHVSNRLILSDDALTGDVAVPIVDKDTKKKILEEECKALAIAPFMASAIGDGANDIPMLQTAGTGIGYFSKPLVQASIQHQIRHTDLVSVLYMQGYRQSEIAGL